MKVRIKRQNDRRSAPYWQVFHFRGEGRITVAAILEKLNERDQLEDIKGKQCRKIRWECGCMQKMCGGCAMVINGHPALACGVFINTDDTEILRLEPLTKFPVVEDLIVDRSVIWERQKEALMYLGIRKHPDPKEHEHQYSAAKCLKCGLFLLGEGARAKYVRRHVKLPVEFKRNGDRMKGKGASKRGRFRAFDVRGCLTLPLIPFIQRACGCNTDLMLNASRKETATNKTHPYCDFSCLYLEYSPA